MQVTTRNTAASFAPNLLITGAPIGVDAAPTDLASVPAGRRITVANGIFVTSGTVITAFAYDGASTCVGRFWWYDASQDLWVPNGNVVTLTTASTNSGQSVVGCTPGCLHHFQVTANAGNTTKIGVVIR